jgi:hypothetical protein
MATSSDLADRRNATPFEPFRIVTNDGEFYDILSRQYLMVGTSQALVGVIDGEFEGVFDEVHHLPIGSIAALVAVPKTKAKRRR